METKLEQIAVKAVNQLPKSVVREIRTPRSVGAGGGRPPPATRWDGKRGVGHRPQATAPILDSTEAAHPQDVSAGQLPADKIACHLPCQATIDRTSSRPTRTHWAKTTNKGGTHESCAETAACHV